MIDLLKTAEKNDFNQDNVFSPEAKVKYCDSIINHSSDENMIADALNKKANALLQLGEEQKAIDVFQNLLRKIPQGNIEQKEAVLKDMAITYYTIRRKNQLHS